MAPFSEQIDAHVERLFALHPAVFDASAVANGTAGQAYGRIVNEIYSERLAEDLSSLGGNDLVLVVGFLNAHQNGASLATMSEVLQWREGHVDDVLKQFEKWQQVERSVRRDLLSSQSWPNCGPRSRNSKTRETALSGGLGSVVRGLSVIRRTGSTPIGTLTR